MQKYYLSDIEVAEIEKFQNNIVMREAVKKVILESVYLHGTLMKDKEANPLLNFTLSLASKTGAFSNEQVGAELKATWQGINLVESGFADIAKIKKEEEPTPVEEVNKAR